MVPGPHAGRSLLMKDEGPLPMHLEAPPLALARKATKTNSTRLCGVCDIMWSQHIDYYGCTQSERTLNTGSTLNTLSGGVTGKPRKNALQLEILKRSVGFSFPRAVPELHEQTINYEPWSFTRCHVL